VRLLAFVRWQASVAGTNTERAIRLKLRGNPAVWAWVRPHLDMSALKEIFGDKVYSSVAKTLPACKSVIDLGSNIGLSSVYFSSLYPGCRLLCVEPLPGNFQLVQKNLASQIAAGSCVAVRAAVCGEDVDSIELGISAPGSASASFTLHGDTAHKISAPGYCMKTLFKMAGFDRADLVKMDVEGAEVHLFRDSAWLDSTGALAVEFHDNSRVESGFDPALKAHGFRIVSEDSHTVLAVRE
jgi:FkbM family methyltransferase